MKLTYNLPLIWYVSENGNQYTFLDGKTLTVFRNDNIGKWMYVYRGQVSKTFDFESQARESAIQFIDYFETSRTRTPLSLPTAELPGA
jgi:hypothetical protein